MSKSDQVEPFEADGVEGEGFVIPYDTGKRFVVWQHEPGVVTTVSFGTTTGLTEQQRQQDIEVLKTIFLTFHPQILQAAKGPHIEPTSNPK